MQEALDEKFRGILRDPDEEDEELELGEEVCYRRMELLEVAQKGEKGVRPRSRLVKPNGDCEEELRYEPRTG